MVGGQGSPSGRHAAWPLLAVLVLLAVVMLFAGPLGVVRGFADGLALAITLLVIGLVLVLVMSRRGARSDRSGSTAGVVSAQPMVARAMPHVETEADVDLEGLDLPLV